MPVSNKTFLRGAVSLLGAGLLVLIGIVAASIILATRTTELNTALLQARNDRLLTEDVLQSLLELETGQRGYLLTGDTAYLRPFELARKRIPGEMKRLNAVGGRIGFRPQEMALLSATVSAKLDEISQTVRLARAGHRDQALSLVSTNRGLALMDNARRMLSSVIAGAEDRVTTNVGATIATSQRLRTVTEAGGALIVLFGLGALLLTIRYTRELREAHQAMEQMYAGLEERVAERTVSLSQANEEIQRFAYIVSHDLRSPLVNIMGFTSELEVGVGTLQQYIAAEPPDEGLKAQARTAVSQDLPEAVRFIRSSTVKMDNLIKAILQLSREGRRVLTPETVDLNKLVTSSIANLKHQADAVGAKLEIQGSLPTLVSDRLALEQVFSNLLDNALKYLSPERAGHIVVSATKRGTRSIVSVKDNGRGIAEQDHQRVFDLFRRAGAQDKPGEGIGLAHVRALVRRLGGEITLRSRLGEGSDFQVELPKSIPAQAS